MLNKDSNKEKLSKSERGLLFSIFLRSFLLQMQMNYVRMQGLGFGMALLPVARNIKLEGDKLKEFLERHLTFFNAHPYYASYALGAVAKMEMMNYPPQATSEMKKKLMGPLGLLGDQVFWNLLKPLCLGLAVVLILGLNYPLTAHFRLEPSLILLGSITVYNFFHFLVKWKGMVSGYKSGEGVVSAINSDVLIKFRFLMGVLLALVAGLFLVKTFYISRDKGAFISALMVVLGGRWLRLPLWLIILTAVAISMVLYFFTNIYSVK
jgi:mannose/fructose/N-acetylgalactosamine-specific phosphotransferase system component IID